MSAATLDAFLNSLANSGAGAARPLAEAIRALAAASAELRGLAARGLRPKAERGRDAELDVAADDLFLRAARQSSVALYVSSELSQPVGLDPQGGLAVAVDPLNGSGDLDIGVPAGTLFSILPVAGDALGQPDETFRQPGRNQLAAGLFVHAAQPVLVLTVGSGTHAFAFSQRLGTFAQARESLVIAPRASELAVDASNTRHWQEAMRLYVDDCLKGAEGPRERDFTLRWSGSLAAEAMRLLYRGGIFLAPADGRKGRLQGTVPLVLNANPLALLVEQAGGAATDTLRPVLDLAPESLKQRTPLVLGARREVERVTRYHTEPSQMADRAPLFGHRGLFRT